MMYSVLLTFTLIFIQAALAAPIHDNSGSIDDSPQARNIFTLTDTNLDMHLDYSEFEQVFHKFDNDSDGQVTSTEFVDLWVLDNIGEVQQAVAMFLNLDVNDDFIIDQTDMPYIFIFFDRNRDNLVSEGEFVIQWVKIAQ